MVGRCSVCLVSWLFLCSGSGVFFSGFGLVLLVGLVFGGACLVLLVGLVGFLSVFGFGSFLGFLTQSVHLLTWWMSLVAIVLVFLQPGASHLMVTVRLFLNPGSSPVSLRLPLMIVRCGYFSRSAFSTAARSVVFFSGFVACLVICHLWG